MDSEEDFGNDCDVCGEPDTATCGHEQGKPYVSDTDDYGEVVRCHSLEQAQRVLRDHEAMEALRAGRVDSLMLVTVIAVIPAEPQPVELPGPMWEAMKQTAPVFSFGAKAKDPADAILAATGEQGTPPETFTEKKARVQAEIDRVRDSMSDTPEDS